MSLQITLGTLTAADIGKHVVFDLDGYFGRLGSVNHSILIPHWWNPEKYSTQVTLHSPDHPPYSKSYPSDTLCVLTDSAEVAA